ncbi:hypothetical protein DXG01_005059 [Tephrocybe rancida]|nr:hypothetical protein DXG01_005059 [Tephrocybe rancida]
MPKPSYASILYTALVLCTSTTTHAAPLATNHADSISRHSDVFLLLGQRIHDPCATHRSLMEKNDGCETETLLFFNALFSEYCAKDRGEPRTADASPTDSILGLFGRDSHVNHPHRHQPQHRRHHAEITSFEHPRSSITAAQR